MPPEENYLKKELYDLVKKDSSIFEFLQSGSLDGIWFWDLEKPENEWMSPTFWTNFGYDPAEKKHLSKEWQDMILKEDLKTATDNFAKHLADPNYPYDQTVRYTKKDGSTAWVRCRGIAIRDENGKPIRMLGAHNDITKIKEVEEKFKAVFDGAIDGILLAEVESKKFVMANNAIVKMLGYSKEEFLSLGVLDIHPEKDIPFVLEQFEKQSKGMIYEALLPVKRKDGSVFYADISPSPIKIGKKEYLLGFFRDVTDRKNAEEKIKKNNEELSKMNKFMIGRELKMAELKKEIEELKAKLENK